MNKSGLLFAFVLLCIYFTLIFCDESETMLGGVKDSAAVKRSDATDLVEESRVRRKHGFHGLRHYWGWHALAIAYFIKVKVVIVAFFVGSAFFWGLRYFWPHKCKSEIVHESSPIVYDHPPPHSYSYHDHIPYSFDHSGPYSDHSGPYPDHSFEATATFDSISSSDPYSGYTGTYSETAPTSAGEHRIKRAAVRRQQHHYMPTEEQIAEFMFMFLGLDSQGCRRRFICEMEFRSKLNPLTSMAFRIVGRSFFGKYTNAHNTNGKATTFFECAAVNPECTVIEENFNEQSVNEESEEESVEEVLEEHAAQENDMATNESATNKAELEADVNSSENEIKENTVMDTNAADMERKNAANLWAERRTSTLLRQHRRRGRKVDIIAASILNRVERQEKEE